MKENICQLCEEYNIQNKLSNDQNLLNIYRFEITYLFNLQPILVLRYFQFMYLAHFNPLLAHLSL